MMIDYFFLLPTCNYIPLYLHAFLFSLFSILFSLFSFLFSLFISSFYFLYLVCIVKLHCILLNYTPSYSCTSFIYILVFPYEINNVFSIPYRINTLKNK
jgi:hypothetical protein